MLVWMILALAVTGALWQLHRRGWTRHDYHNDLLALLVLALATMGFFWRLLFTHGVWMPVGGGDLVSFLYPVYSFIARSLRVGDFPLWNPYLYGGAPFISDNQSSLLYPINLIAFALRPEVDYRTMELLSVAHFYLAGVCAYLGLRYMGRQPLRRWAALVGAAAFMFSDLFVTHFGNLNMIACAAWLPLIFFLLRRALDEQRPAFAAGSGLFLGIAALAGHVQPLLYTVLALGLYLLYHLSIHRRSPCRDLLAKVALFALAMLVAFSVAAPALLPSYEMSQLTLRSELSYEDASEYSLPPLAWVGLLVPDIFGRGPRGFWGPWPRVEVGYVGILTLLLAGIALVLRRDRLAGFLALLGILAALLAMGDATALHGWLYRFVPGFDLIRAPARFIYLLDFALASLAALGLDSLLRPLPHATRSTWQRVLRLLPAIALGAALILLPLAQGTLFRSQDRSPEVLARLLRGTHGITFAFLMLGCGLLLLYLRGMRRIGPLSLGIAAFALIVVDLALLGAHTELEFNDPLAGFQHPEAIAFLKSDAEHYRIDTRTEVWNVWQPNLSLLNGIQDVWGIWNPLVLGDFHRYWEGLGSRSTPLYDFLNAKYIVGHKDVVLDWDKFELAFDGDPAVNIYRNTRVLPRAFVVHDAWAVASQDEAFAAIHQADFDPSTTVVVENAEGLDGQASADAEANIVAYSNNAIRIKASTSAPGYLVLSEVYYPGWLAEVDGNPVPIARANYAFRAVYLSPGEHEVRLYFRPRTWLLGLGLSALCWAALAVGTLRWARGRWRRQADKTL